ncbi:MAG: response regulator [Solirubrobacteraceae bacterium]|nr:response regulator [Solirubrobacteraceae bacterium]
MTFAAASRHMTRAHILIVDDERANVVLLERLLERAGYSELESTTSSTTVVDRCRGRPPDLLVLDLHMPDVGGLEILRDLAPLRTDRQHFPVLVCTGDSELETRRAALGAGATDFVVKPYDMLEVTLRVGHLLEVHRLHRRLQDENTLLEEAVRERTEELESARTEEIRRLALASEYRDDVTHEHAQRIGRTSEQLALAMNLDRAAVELIGRAAPLHDIGKVAVPDSVLLKPGPLTKDEFRAMQAHTTIGHQILDKSRSPLLQLAAEIAISHHEHWDGRGYPHGLAGPDIPLAGRIVAVADVFDALTHDRPYKRAWPLEAAHDEIRAQSGAQFDPAAVQAFEQLDHGGLSAPLREDRVVG